MTDAIKKNASDTAHALREIARSLSARSCNSGRSELEHTVGELAELVEAESVEALHNFLATLVCKRLPADAALVLLEAPDAAGLRVAGVSGLVPRCGEELPANGLAAAVVRSGSGEVAVNTECAIRPRLRWSGSGRAQSVPKEC